MGAGVQMSRVVCIVLLLPLCGCIAFRTGPEQTEDRVTSQRDVETKVVSFDGFNPTVTDSSEIRLRLFALGEFTIVSEKEVEIMSRVPGRTAFGLMPWMGDDYMQVENKKFGHFVLSFCLNYILVLTPTLTSLLVEPFSDYPRVEGFNDHNFAGFGLFGFYRYNDKSEKWNSAGSRTDRSESPIENLPVGEFSIDYAGRILRSENREIVLPESLRFGHEVRARLLSAKMRSASLQEKADKFIGSEIVWDIGGRGSPETRQTFAVSAEKILGRWEYAQSIRMFAHGKAVKTGTEEVRVLRGGLEFRSGGACEWLLHDGKADIRTTGMWKQNGDSIAMTVANSDGVVMNMTVRSVISDGSELEVRCEDLNRALSQFMLASVIGSVPKGVLDSASYGDNDAILARVTSGNGDAQEGDAPEKILDIVCSPLILEREKD